MAKQTLTAIEDQASDLGPNPIVSVLDEIGAEGGLRTDGDFSALAMLLIDSSMNGDDSALRAIQDWLRAEYARASGQSDPGGIEARGRTRGLIDASHWAIQRVLPLSDIRWVEAGSHAERFMSALRREPGLSNRDLAERLAVDETQISRSGRKLRLTKGLMRSTTSLPASISTPACLYRALLEAVISVTLRAMGKIFYKVAGTLWQFTCPSPWKGEVRRGTSFRLWPRDHNAPTPALPLWGRGFAAPTPSCHPRG